MREIIGACRAYVKVLYGQTLDRIAVASGAGQFKTLVAAVTAAGLVETLQGKGPFHRLFVGRVFSYPKTRSVSEVSFDAKY
jgi:hypothetical protein